MSESSFKKAQQRKVRQYSRRLCARFKVTRSERRAQVDKLLLQRSHRSTDPRRVDQQVRSLSHKMLLNNQLLKSDMLKRWPDTDWRAD